MRLSSSGKRSAATGRVKVIMGFQGLQSVDAKHPLRRNDKSKASTKTAALKQLFSEAKQ
jgi:hypothetical protein